MFPSFVNVYPPVGPFPITAAFFRRSENDAFAEKMKTFLKDSRDQHEVLTSMHKSMEKQYSDLGNYFAFKTKTFALEEFFMVNYCIGRNKREC